MKTLLILCLLVACDIKTTYADIVRKIDDYFKSDTFLIFQEKWQTERKSFENALTSVLGENYGARAMNVYVKKLPDFYKISDGFYFTDNVVDVILFDLKLHELPNMIAPDVTCAVASNFIRVKGGLQRMIINTNYLLLRNQSAIIFADSEQDPFRRSPFSFQQVQESGQLTIVAEDCILSGYTIASLSGQSINLGLDTFKVTNCKFTVEIYLADVRSPPVIGPYFSKEQSKSLETMLSKPLRFELMPKLQAAVFSYVNTSTLLGDMLSKLRSQQQEIFTATSTYMNECTRNFSKYMAQENQGVLKLESKKVSWNPRCSNESRICELSIELKGIKLYGFDTAYSAHSGGPYKLQSARIAETIRFNTMLVRGELYFENATFKAEHDFAVELRDVGVNVELEARTGSPELVATKLDFVGWRDIEFSIMDLQLFMHTRKSAQSFVTGYLISEIPKCLLEQLSKWFGYESVQNDSNSDNPDEAPDKLMGAVGHADYFNGKDDDSKEYSYDPGKPYANYSVDLANEIK